jgi:hypothetical protein
MIPVFERAKTVHSSEGAATVIGSLDYRVVNIMVISEFRIGRKRSWREVPSHLPGGTEENHENPQSGCRRRTRDEAR